jgi:hypothetical protein
MLTLAHSLRVKVRSVGFLVAAALCGPGCNAHIGTFEASLRHICPGERVEITWEVTGSASVTVSPPIKGAPNGAVASTDHATIAPTAKTRVSLRVTRILGEPTGADIDIDLPAPVAIAADLNDAPSCTAGVLTLTTRVKGFSPGVTADVVALEGSEKRSIDISRADAAGKTITARVAPGVSTDAFSAMPAEGDWTLSSTLMPGESCSNPPHVLTVYVYTACKGAAR